MLKTEEAIRKIMERRGMRFIDLSAKLGIATNTLAGRLKSKNISIQKLIDTLQVLGYKVVLVPETKMIEHYEYEIK